MCIRAKFLSFLLVAPMWLNLEWSVTIADCSSDHLAHKERSHSDFCMVYLYQQRRMDCHTYKGLERIGPFWSDKNCTCLATQNELILCTFLFKASPWEVEIIFWWTGLDLAWCNFSCFPLWAVFSGKCSILGRLRLIMFAKKSHIACMLESVCVAYRRRT